MGFQIQDGRGSGARAVVDDEGHLVVDAINLSEAAHQSDAHGLAFTWTTQYVSTAVNLQFISIRNDADENLHIASISVGSSATNLFTLLEVTSGTPAGSTITAQNLNLISGVSKANTAFGDASVTGTLAGNTIAVRRVAALTSQKVDTDDSLILGTNDTIALTAASSGSVEAVVSGWWDVA